MEARSEMLAPKFTLRQLLIAMILFALVSALLGWTSKGSIVAYGLGLAIVALIIPLSVYSIAFWVCRGLVGAPSESGAAVDSTSMKRDQS